ncbi:acetyl-CoA carboxylase biotin carboxyl carrier protein [Secundilactobacillus paracollinoides]|uniref:Biotin carboxyl carrier protein of acetyl-CoA carboxylase n=2 Tax=Secundilactobacillus paracollinoides TaxID=240427 RepID=A0A1B2J1D1_9LACO|nr:acetyl-CoA carboxylase biotin carboxyl carrier protein [Secundilactobacillus paracollinoides]ANZ62150.1 hypothetical protein AYR61_12885 [Secundilactobacillus paracollinoides]ANZ68097.1 hypothetical protein AYR63_13760 [Secundilactobacillus paracollinoides]KRL76425.1 hypothetical protein FC17_GL001928 [Secundilactobacillus paracollinoides DSM 15502 = JCM 11969]
MTIEEIQTIINQINDSEIREVELDYQDLHLYLNKNKQSHRVDQSAAVPVQTAAPVAQTAPVAQPSEQAASDAPAEPVVADNDETIKAPLVGVIYLQPAPDKPAYKQVGDHIEKGDVVCVVEAMKMMTEIKSQVSGTLSQVLVENEEVVEYDQPLFKVTP